MGLVLLRGKPQAVESAWWQTLTDAIGFLVVTVSSKMKSRGRLVHFRAAKLPS